MTEQEVIADIRSHYSDKDRGDFDVADLIGRHGSVIEAIMYSTLFRPEITETLGFVLLRPHRYRGGEDAFVERDFGEDRSF